MYQLRKVTSSPVSSTTVKDPYKTFYTAMPFFTHDRLTRHGREEGRKQGVCCVMQGDVRQTTLARTRLIRYIYVGVAAEWHERQERESTREGSGRARNTTKVRRKRMAWTRVGRSKSIFQLEKLSFRQPNKGTL